MAWICGRKLVTFICYSSLGKMILRNMPSTGMAGVAVQSVTSAIEK